jgi:hypothetical protein
MKIEKFKNFKKNLKVNESLEDVGYEQISEDDFFSQVLVQYDIEWSLDNWVDFNQDQYQKVKELFPNYSSRLGYDKIARAAREKTIYSDGFMIFKTKEMFGPFGNRSVYNDTAFYAIQTDDEWFWVSWWLDKDKKEGELRFFKCDQFSGLMNLLTDLKNE